MRRIITYYGIFLFVLISSKVKAQALTANNTSEQSVRMYQSVIRNNRQLVSYIEYTFVKKGIPKHLRNLAIIESGLDRHQVSHAGAKGVWQFMPAHASMYGLTEDERSDMYKSTQTAAVSLSNLYKKYRNWITVVAAYNCGEGNIQKAMSRAGSRLYTDFRPYLPQETQNHVQKYLNASYATGELSQVLNNYHNFAAQNNSSGTLRMVAAPRSTHKGKKGADLVETQLNSAYRISAIAEVLEISPKQLLSWNPGIERRLQEKGESDFYLPTEMMVQFEINKTKILSNSLKAED